MYRQNWNIVSTSQSNWRATYCGALNQNLGEMYNILQKTAMLGVMLFASNEDYNGTGTLYYSTHEIMF